MTGPQSLDDLLAENGRLRERIARYRRAGIRDQESETADPIPDACALASDEPTYTLKARDPLAMGLLSVLACLRAGDFKTADQQFAGLSRFAQEGPCATEAEIHAAWSVAADMEVWRFGHPPVRLGDEMPRQPPTLTVVP